MNPPTPPPALPEFPRVHREWNSSLERYVVTVLPGEYYVTRADEWIWTNLGSCLAACIRDRVSGIGGMNHFLLPASTRNVSSVEETRFGSFAMARLLATILHHGGRRQNLEAKIFGGGSMVAHMGDIGQSNIEFARKFLKAEGVPLVAEDVGLSCPRTVFFSPTTGFANVRRLRSLHNRLVAEEESRNLKRLQTLR